MTKLSKTPQSLKGSRYDSAERSPGLLFWKAFHQWTRQIRSVLEALELTQGQFSVLAAISYLGTDDREVSQQAVASQLSMDKMMVSDVATTLEGKGWLTRKPSKADGRSWSLALTPSSRGKLKLAVPAVESVDEKYFGKLSPQERKQFLACLSKLEAQV